MSEGRVCLANLHELELGGECQRGSQPRAVGRHSQNAEYLRHGVAGCILMFFLSFTPFRLPPLSA